MGNTVLAPVTGAPGPVSLSVCRVCLGISRVHPNTFVNGNKTKKEYTGSVYSYKVDLSKSLINYKIYVY